MKYLLVSAAAVMAITGAAAIGHAQMQDKGPAPGASGSPGAGGGAGGPGGGAGGGADRGTERAPGGSAGERTQQPSMKDQKAPGKGAESQSGKGDPKAAQGETKGQMDRKADQGDRGQDKKADTQRQQDKKAADTDRQQRDQKKAADTQGQQDKKAADTNRQQDQKKAADTERQQRDQKKAADTQRQQDKKAADTNRQQQDQKKADQQQRQPGDRDQKAAQGDQRGDQKRVQVSDQQRTTVREQIRRDRNVERISRSRLNVNIDVGVAIPRSVRLHTLPVTLVSTVPAYRGYSYIVLEDDTICIVDPKTYVIVDVIDAGGGGLRADRGGARLTLAQEDMRFIYRTLPKERRANVRVQLALGAEVPRDVELYEFPAEVVERVPDVRRYRYVVVEDDIVIVDPNDHQVSLVINE